MQSWFRILKTIRTFRTCPAGQTQVWSRRGDGITAVVGQSPTWASTTGYTQVFTTQSERVCAHFDWDPGIHKTHLRHFNR